MLAEKQVTWMKAKYHSIMADFWEQAIHLCRFPGQPQQCGMNAIIHLNKLANMAGDLKKHGYNIMDFCKR